jgi:hypothetical protein
MDEACNVPVDSTHEAPLAKLKLVAEDGRELAPTEVLIASRDAAWTGKVAREGPHNWKVSRLAPRPVR